MKINSLKTLLAVVAISFLTVPAYALSLTDPGVVGAASGETSANNSVPENLAIAQHLLNMAANSVDPSGCSLSGTAPCYTTGPTEYSATLTGGTQITGTTNVGSFEWVLAKYDGPQGGYVLFHIPTWGSSIIPQTSYNIWTNVAGSGYGLSGFVGWGSTTRVPDGGTTLSLLGLALAGIGAFRRFAA